MLPCTSSTCELGAGARWTCERTRAANADASEKTGDAGFEPEQLKYGRCRFSQTIQAARCSQRNLKPAEPQPKAENRWQQNRISTMALVAAACIDAEAGAA